MKCGWCGAQGEWKINSDGGYGFPELWACTNCLKIDGPANGCVPRLLEAYPREDAEALCAALNLPAPKA